MAILRGLPWLAHGPSGAVEALVDEAAGGVRDLVAGCG